MDSNELKYQITALIDGEIHDDKKAAEIRNLIEANPDLKREYEILYFTKSLVRSKCKFCTAPEALRGKIIKQIKPGERSLPQPLKFFTDVFSKPAYAISAAAALVVVIFLLILNQSPNDDMSNLAAEQRGKDNMFVQASNNFDNIMEGKLKPQILTDDPDNIKRFFKEKGVKYPTRIPQVDKWKILGAVVSEASGEMYAHHVYTNDEGKLIYVFQVDDACLQEKVIIKLSDDLMNYLEKGNCYISTKNDCTTLMKKMDDNICAIVSNASEKEIENLFCSL